MNVQWLANRNYIKQLIFRNKNRYIYRIPDIAVKIFLLTCIICGLILFLKEPSDIIFIILFIPIVRVCAMYKMIIVVIIAWLLMYLVSMIRIKKKIKQEECEGYYNTSVTFLEKELRLYVMGKEYIIPYADILCFTYKKRKTIIFFKNGLEFHIPRNVLNLSKTHIYEWNRVIEKETIEHTLKNNIKINDVIKIANNKYRKISEMYLLWSIIYYYVLLSQQISSPALATIMLIIYLLIYMVYKYWKSYLVKETESKLKMKKM